MGKTADVGMHYKSHFGAVTHPGFPGWGTISFFPIPFFHLR